MFSAEGGDSDCIPVKPRSIICISTVNYKLAIVPDKKESEISLQK